MRTNFDVANWALKEANREVRKAWLALSSTNKLHSTEVVQLDGTIDALEQHLAKLKGTMDVLRTRSED